MIKLPAAAAAAAAAAVVTGLAVGCASNGGAPSDTGSAGPGETNNESPGYSDARVTITVGGLEWSVTSGKPILQSHQDRARVTDARRQVPTCEVTVESHVPDLLALEYKLKYSLADDYTEVIKSGYFQMQPQDTWVNTEFLETRWAPPSATGLPAFTCEIDSVEFFEPVR